MTVLFVIAWLVEKLLDWLAPSTSPIRATPFTDSPPKAAASPPPR